MRSVQTLPFNLSQFGSVSCIVKLKRHLTRRRKHMVKSKIGVFLSLPFLVILSLFFASASAVLAFIDSVVDDVLWVWK